MVGNGPGRPRDAGDSQAGDWRLNSLEKEMLGKAEAGEWVDREGPFDQGAMQGWGPDRSVRARVLRRLLIDEEWAVHAKGVRLRGIRVSGCLDLESASLRCPLYLDGCYFDYGGPVILDYATASVLALTGCHMAGLKGNLLVVTKELDLTATSFTGPVWLGAAEVWGQILLRGAMLNGTGKDGGCLVADEIKAGDVILAPSDDGSAFAARGTIQLTGAHIRGQLSLRGAELSDTRKAGDAALRSAGDEPAPRALTTFSWSARTSLAISSCPARC
jgi:hypothetical protein